MLAKRFEHILHDLGMAGLEHPLFYHAPVGIRFKIGGEEPIYLDRRAAKLKTNPAYVQGALDRAAAIYRALPAVPDLLRIDGYPDEEPAESLLTVIRQRVGLPVPDEQLSATEQDEDGDTHAQVQFYWDLSKISFQPELLLREIILGDIGGWNGFVSSVYLAGPGPFLYHLYDDRGLDVLGGISVLGQLEVLLDKNVMDGLQLGMDGGSVLDLSDCPHTVFVLLQLFAERSGGLV